jgi:Uma2 family endonuclease
MSEPSKGKREATCADLEALPEGMRGELIEGELHLSPRPTGPHILAQHRLAHLLTGPFDLSQGGPGGWWILPETECHFPRPKAEPNVFYPDIAGWRRERLPAIPRDLQVKPLIYLRGGVKHLWLIDPLERRLDVLKAQGGAWILAGIFSDDDRLRAEPFEALELDLLLLWGETRPAEEGR